ncbi:MAG: 5-(carboxyamino)imidazole ribonucleotide synthase [Sandaracinaceae bacterium]|nr:5-(carboxyamino)imidazole ribonucleotide synthase [Sandaracinaceae bacterium]
MKVGILGGGQLAQMLAQAGNALGVETTFVDPGKNAPAARYATQIRAAYDDLDALAQLAASVDVVTYEFENVPEIAATMLAKHVHLRPLPIALSTSQDRLTEKTMFASLGIPTAPFQPVASAADLEAAVRAVGLPAVLKTRRMGYDGKGQLVLRGAADVPGAFEKLGSVPCILEGFVRFERELSLVCVRGRDGETRFYPLTQTIHEGGILRMTVSPAPRLDDELTKKAQEYGERVLRHLYYVGVLALELFEESGNLRANEIAPRVHNSGHWTIEGAHTSQFENHMRAIAEMPLGDTGAKATTVSINLLGDSPALEEMNAVVGAHAHLYGKTAAPLRKVGHVTILDDGSGAFDERVERLRDLVARATAAVSA